MVHARTILINLGHAKQRHDADTLSNAEIIKDTLLAGHGKTPLSFAFLSWTVRIPLMLFRRLDKNANLKLYSPCNKGQAHWITNPTPQPKALPGPGHPKR